MDIRRAEEKDLEFVKKLLSQVLEIHADIRPDIFISGTRKYTDKELLDIFKCDLSPVFVAEENGNFYGYCFCQINERKGTVNMKDMKTLYIDDLCVDASARGKHVGKSLYDYVLDYAKGIGCYNVTLNVWEGNDSARAFYEKMGLGVQKTMMEKIL